MFFNSFAFLIFLPVVFGIYWGFFAKKIQGRNLFLIAASYFFYGCWDWRFLGLIILSSVVDYFVAIQMEKTEEDRRRKRLLWLSLGVNLGVLGVFKYFNFFAASLVDLFQLFGFEPSPITLHIILPVGISFYTFQTLSYTIDVYRKKIPACHNLPAFFAYVSFFPQLVAGPIERARNLIPQFQSEKKFSYPQAVSGLRLILWGMFKKVVIADQLAYFVDAVYAWPGAYPGFPIVLAVLFFTLQLYCDFSGYSDIAIGTARLFGFDLMTNFRTPFFSTSLREFWQRWHISLSSWFGEYLYVPLGGNRVSAPRWVFNILIVFTVSGLWHGAAWNFLIWGIFLGIAYLLQMAHYRKKQSFMLPAWARGILTFGIFATSMLLFRGGSLYKVYGMVKMGGKGMWDQIGNWDAVVKAGSSLPFGPEGGWGVLIPFLLFIPLEIWMGKTAFDEKLQTLPKAARWGMGWLILLLIVLFGAFELKQAFIYFQF